MKSAVVQNAKWIIGGRILHALLQLLIGTLTARYLGPSDYGLIHFAASVTAFAVPVMQLGLQSTLVQEYVERKAQDGTVMGTALVLNLVSGFACVLGVTVFAAAAVGHRETVTICVLYSLSLLFQTLELIQYRFQAGLQSKYSSIAALLGYLAVSGYRIWLLATGKSAAWFALSHSVEFGVTGAMLLILCRRIGVGHLGFRWDMAKALLSRSRYYIPAVLLVTCFQNTDHVLLKLLSGDEANGLYTCAVTCATVTGFVFYAIVDSVRPMILASRNSDGEFAGSMAGLYGVLNLLSLGQSIAFSLLAGPIVGFLYGQAYLAAVPVLRILVWNTAFSMMGAARNVWLLAREKHHLLWRINLCGAVSSLVLNGLMIPLWGAEGAALASVLTQFFTNFAVGFWMPSMKENQRLLLQGLKISSIRAFVRQLKK